MESRASAKLKKKAMVLTIGTGDKKRLEQSLLRPIQKSINDGKWDKVILLPSQETATNADQILNMMDNINIICEPLNISGLETNADECFGHFDQILEELINHEGFDRTNITLDFTRGTKAMSAALLMAGMSRGITTIQYISGDQRDDRGMVIPDTEIIEKVNTHLVDTRRLLNQAERLMRRGNFEAVCILLHNTTTSESSGYLSKMQYAMREINSAARVYSAWDRFDYKDAVKCLNNGQELFRDNVFSPTPKMGDWLEALSSGIKRDNMKEAAVYIQRLACDMLANAERRKRDGLYEDAYVRCYRVLELIGQYCLFQHGYDSGALPENDKHVVQLAKYLKKKKSNPLGETKCNKKTAGQYQVTRFLKILDDSRGNSLDALGKVRQSFLTRNRNKSILFHGFSAANAEQIKNLDASINDLETFLCDDFSVAKDYLTVARSIKFGRE